MRTRAKVDANQAEIVRALKGAGATVLSLAAIGHDAPDVLVGFRWTNYLLEVKQPGEDTTLGQAAWHRVWRGRPVRVVSSIEDALRVIGALEGHV